MRQGATYKRNGVFRLSCSQSYICRTTYANIVNIDDVMDVPDVSVVSVIQTRSACAEAHEWKSHWRIKSKEMLQHEIQTGLHRRESWESAREEMGDERNSRNKTRGEEMAGDEGGVERKREGRRKSQRLILIWGELGLPGRKEERWSGQRGRHETDCGEEIEEGGEERRRTEGTWLWTLILILVVCFVSTRQWWKQQVSLSRN